MAVLQDDLPSEMLLGPNEAPQMQKYDEFVPSHLLRKVYAADFLDAEEVRAYVRNECS